MFSFYRIIGENPYVKKLEKAQAPVSRDLQRRRRSMQKQGYLRFGPFMVLFHVCSRPRLKPLLCGLFFYDAQQYVLTAPVDPEQDFVIVGFIQG